MFDRHGLGQKILGCLAALLFSGNLAAQVWPDHATKLFLAQKNQVPVEFWDLPLAQQVQAQALDAFYVQKYHWQGDIRPTDPQIMVGPRNRRLMAKYLARKFQAPFYDPTSPFYRQAIVTVEEHRLQIEPPCLRPIVIFHTNPSLPVTQQGPIAQFLAKMEAEFGDRLQFAIDPLATFHEGSRAFFQAAGRGAQLVKVKNQIGWINLGLQVGAGLFTAQSAQEIEEESTLAHELVHARVFQALREGRYNYTMGFVVALNKAAQGHRYNGSFALDEIPAYLVTAKAMLRELHQYWLAAPSLGATTAVSFAENNLPPTVAERLVPEITGREYLHRRLDFALSAVMEFAELAQIVSHNAFYILLMTAANEGQFAWQRLRQASAAEPASLNIPYHPMIFGVLLRSLVQQKFKYAFIKHDVQEDPIEEFSLLIPYNVLSAIAAPRKALATPAGQVAKFRILDAAVFNRESSSRTIADEVALRRLKRIIYNPQAFKEFLRFLDEQQNFLAELIHRLEPIYAEWASYRDNPGQQTVEAVVRMREQLTTVLALLEGPVEKDDFADAAQIVPRGPCAAWLRE